jgi:hypothetical protein
MSTKLVLDGGILLSAIMMSSSVLAYDEPHLNLGATSFLDGTPPSGPGLYLMQYLQTYSGELKDKDGDNLPLPKHNVDITASLSQLLYVSPNKISSDLSWGVHTILPIVLSADVDDGLGGSALTSGTGMGDLVAGAFLQADPVMGPDGPKFVQRFAVDFLAPTGDYDPKNAVNPSSNFWSFNPNWAATFWFSPKWTASWRLHYLWNAKNNKPNDAYGPEADTTQAGQVLHANFATEYAVTPQLRVGLNGYWLQQIEDTKVNGEHVSGTRERVWALGPGAVYSFSKEDHVFANLYSEFGAENRPEGTKLIFRFVHHF